MSNEELVIEIQNGAAERMGELWDQVAGLVKWKARHIMTALELRGNLCGVDFDDLVQSGYPAMVAAVESYSPEKGAFSSWMMYQLQTAFAEATGYRTRRGQNEPLNNSLSLDKPLTEEADSSLFGDFIPDRQATAVMDAVEDRQYREQLHNAMEKALKVIPGDYSEILRLRYYQGMTLEDAGRSLGISAEQARNRENKGIRRLRNPSLAATLRPFYDFDYYCCTGLASFRRKGVSVQEHYILMEENRRERRRLQSRDEMIAEEERTRQLLEDVDRFLSARRVEA